MVLVSILWDPRINHRFGGNNVKYPAIPWELDAFLEVTISNNSYLVHLLNRCR